MDPEKIMNGFSLANQIKLLLYKYCTAVVQINKLLLFKYQDDKDLESNNQGRLLSENFLT